MKDIFSKVREIRLSPVQIIPASFLITIIVGAIILMLPVMTESGQSTDFLTALFTATTSVCVTGLVVVDTYAHWSFLGQFIIMILVQIGGLGMITIASMLMVLTRKKFSLTDRMLLRDAFNLDTNTRLLQFLIRVFKATFLVEGVGAVLYAIVFIPDYGVRKGLWSAVFNAVSAFCNAGMDVIGPSSMAQYKFNPIVMSVTMLLITFGGIGYVVWFDLFEKLREGRKKNFSISTIMGRCSEHSKLVLTFSAVLVFGGALVFFLIEYNNPGTIGNMDLGGKLANSLFQSVTLRTAGFSTVPQENLRTASVMVSYVLMFIGGSPIGTAGGIKTVTIFLLIMNVRTYVRNQDDKVIFKRRVSEESMRKASAVAFIAFVAVIFLTLLLTLVNPVSLEDAMFEVVSACGTVGLTRALTPTLGISGRIIIIIAMYLGRIGPISMVAFFSGDNNDNNKIKYSEGVFYVG